MEWEPKQVIVNLRQNTCLNWCVTSSIWGTRLATCICLQTCCNKAVKIRLIFWISLLKVCIKTKDFWFSNLEWTEINTKQYSIMQHVKKTLRLNGCKFYRVRFSFGKVKTAWCDVCSFLWLLLDTTQWGCALLTCKRNK